LVAVILREEYRMIVFQNRVLREIVGIKRERVSGDWRKLHNKELQDLYRTVMQSGEMRWAGHVARVG
jgi:hypothetical protein